MPALLLAAWMVAAQRAPAPDEGPTPPRALLEFLGRFEDADGAWIDPLSLMVPELRVPAPAPSDEAGVGSEDDDDDARQAAPDPDARGGARPGAGPGSGGAR